MKKLNNLTAKVFSIGAIIGLLLIGNLMIHSKLNDRKSTRDEACNSISRSAGGPFILSGVSVVIPYDYNETYYDDANVKRSKRLSANLYIHPSKMEIDSVISAERRTVGIYSTPVFTGSILISADFELEEIKNRFDFVYHLDKAYFLLQIGDYSLQSHPEFKINGKKCNVYLEENGIASKMKYSAGKYHFETDLKIRGAKSFKSYITAENTTMNVKSNWTSPGFTDFDYLPAERNISDEGFDATWNIPFSSGNMHSIGFELIESVDVYKKLDRAINYGFLFIIVPFIALFLFEMFAGIQLHPVQYLLSGAASVVFFLLLLALSEHIDFGAAYLISGAASGILVSLYITSISRHVRIGLIMTGVFLSLYAYLYYSLLSEDYALLIGSIFAFTVIAVLMFFTRKGNLVKMEKNKLPEDKDIESSSC